MPDPATLLLFAASTLALLAIPGPSVLFVVGRTLEHGRTAGLVSVAGIETGALLHVLAAAAGLSAVLASSPVALDLVRAAGGGYLVWLGVRAIQRHRAAVADPDALRRSDGRLSHRALFREGVLVDVLNPKTALFFLAFLPGFVEPGHGPVAAQVAVLGLCFVALAALSDGAYAVLAARLRDRLRGAVHGRRLAYGSAAIYVLLGVVALAGGA